MTAGDVTPMWERSEPDEPSGYAELTTEERIWRNRQDDAEASRSGLGQRAATGWSDALLEPGGVIFDMPSMPDALWGRGGQVIAARGEPTMIYGPTGLGKTTLMQRFGLAAIGIGPSDVLGYDVKRIEGNLLYIAADRPMQAKRSFRRMVEPGDRLLLDEKWVWDARRGFRVSAQKPDRLLRIAESIRAELVLIDSIKDVLDGVATDEGGLAYNNTVQTCVANGVDVVAAHHPRKASSDGRGELSLDDVYGSTWLTAGSGSVVALEGTTGSGVISWRHLKMPAEEVGPFDIAIEYDMGSISRLSSRELEAYLVERGASGATTSELARYVTGGQTLSDAETKKVTRKLEKLEGDGRVVAERSLGVATIWRTNEGGL
jgi:replicative DNA helicase